MPRKDSKIAESGNSKLGVGQEECVSPESTTIFNFLYNFL